MGHSFTLLICTDGAFYLLCTRSPEMRHAPSASLFRRRPLRPLCVSVCVCVCLTLRLLGFSQAWGAHSRGSSGLSSPILPALLPGDRNHK